MQWQECHVAQQTCNIRPITPRELLHGLAKQVRQTPDPIVPLKGDPMASALKPADFRTIRNCRCVGNAASQHALEASSLAAGSWQFSQFTSIPAL